MYLFILRLYFIIINTKLKYIYSFFEYIFINNHKHNNNNIIYFYKLLASFISLYIINALYK